MSKRSMKTIIQLALALSVLLACEQVPNIPEPSTTATPKSTVTPVPTTTPTAVPTAVPSKSPQVIVSPTATPTPTVTPTPVATPTPSATPTPEPTPVPTPTLAPLDFQRLIVIAGNGEVERAENGLNADKIGFSNTIAGVDTDAEGNIWLLDQSNGRLVYVTPEQGTSSDRDVKLFRIFWVRKTGLQNPSSFVIDKRTGDFYIVEGNNHRVIKLDKNLENQTVVAGTGAQGFNGDGLASESQLDQPSDVAVDNKGNLYITDTGNHLVRKVTPDGKLITIAGKYQLDNRIKNGDNRDEDDDETPTFLPIGETKGDDGPARDAQVNTPMHVAVDQNGVVYFSSKSNTIRRIKNDLIDRFVGVDASASYNGDNVRADLAALNGPTDIQIGPDGLMYFIDLGNKRIRRINPDGKIKDIAGNGKDREYTFSLTDLEKVELLPEVFAFDAQGNFFVYDGKHRRLRQGEVQEK